MAVITIPRPCRAEVRAHAKHWLDDCRTWNRSARAVQSPSELQTRMLNVWGQGDQMASFVQAAEQRLMRRVLCLGPQARAGKAGPERLATPVGPPGGVS